MNFSPPITPTPCTRPYNAQFRSLPSYIFPPTPDGIVKFAIHGPGWINPTSHNGHPIPSIPKEGHYRLPQEAIQALKINLANTYPELAKKEWFETRLCWCVVLPSLFTPRNPLKKQVLRVPLE